MSEWKEHDGGPQPEETRGRNVEILMRRGSVASGVFCADDIVWSWADDFGAGANILRYRVLSDTPQGEEVADGDAAEYTLRPGLAVSQRAYIATMMLQGLLAGGAHPGRPKLNADDAVEHADALLSALARKE